MEGFQYNQLNRDFLSTTTQKNENLITETKKKNRITFLEPNVDILNKSLHSSHLPNDTKAYKKPSFSDQK